MSYKVRTLYSLGCRPLSSSASIQRAPVPRTVMLEINELYDLVEKYSLY